MARRPATKGATTRRAAMPTADGLKNILSGLGGQGDKLANTMFTVSALDRTQLDMAYRGDWIARKGVDIPAFDATREWRSWQADRSDIGLIEEVEKKFLVQQKVMRTLQKARLYGGAALVMGVDDGKNQDQPLDVERIKRGSLVFLHSVSRYEIVAGPPIDDILNPYFGEPSYYDQHGAKTGSVRIHPSRVVRFLGNPIFDQSFTADGWGDSVLASVSEAIMGAGMVTNSVAQLVAEAKIDVIKLPGLSENIETEAYEQNLKKRFEVANFAKSVYRVLIMDKDEEWQRIAANFAGLPDIQRLFMLIVSGAFDIPAVRFLSQSPAGLSATGESDIRNYYDRCGTVQKIEIQPSLKKLDDVIIRSALGPIQPDKSNSIYYTWNPLWQLTDVEKADVDLKRSQAFKIDVDTGLINSVVLKKARENQIIENGTYPGFEQILDDYDDNPDGVGEPNTPDNPPPVLDRRVKDATTPRSLYLRREVLNVDDIREWAKSQGFDTIVKDLHVTIVYSKEPVDWIKVGSSDWGGQGPDSNLTIPKGGPRVIERFGEGAVVLAFSNTQLQWRHEDTRRQGASSDFDDYTPHVTITWSPPDGMDLDGVRPYDGPIVLGPEIFEEIKQSFDPYAEGVEDTRNEFVLINTDETRGKNG